MRPYFNTNNCLRGRGFRDSRNPSSPAMLYSDYCHTRMSEKLPYKHGAPFMRNKLV
jgi:hypothetical protein